MKLLSRTVGWLIRAAALVVALFALATGAYAAAALHPLAGLAFLLAGWIPVVLVHELGHAIAARLVGWRVAIFHVAPFTIRTRPFDLRLDGRLAGPDIAGFVLSLPRDLTHDTWRRSAWISAGGPIASWILAAACLCLACGADLSRLADGAAVVLSGERLEPAAPIEWDRGPPLGGRENALHTLPVAFALYSLTLAIISSWPASLRNGWRNDASKVAMLQRLRPPSPALGEASQLARSLWTYDVPTRAFEPSLVEAIEKDAAGRRLFADFVEALRADDESALRGAAERLGANHPKTDEASVAAGLVAAWFDGDAARADDCLCSAGAFSDSDVRNVRQLALAMIFRLEGDISAAEQALDAIPRTALWNGLAEQALTGQLRVSPCEGPDSSGAAQGIA